MHAHACTALAMALLSDYHDVLVLAEGPNLVAYHALSEQRLFSRQLEAHTKSAHSLTTTPLCWSEYGHSVLISRGDELVRVPVSQAEPDQAAAPSATLGSLTLPAPAHSIATLCLELDIYFAVCSAHCQLFLCTHDAVVPLAMVTPPAPALSIGMSWADRACWASALHCADGRLRVALGQASPAALRAHRQRSLAVHAVLCSQAAAIQAVLDRTHAASTAVVGAMSHLCNGAIAQGVLPEGTAPSAGAALAVFAAAYQHGTDSVAARCIASWAMRHLAALGGITKLAQASAGLGDAQATIHSACAAVQHCTDALQELVSYSSPALQGLASLYRALHRAVVPCMEWIASFQLCVRVLAGLVAASRANVPAMLRRGVALPAKATSDELASWRRQVIWAARDPAQSNAWLQPQALRAALQSALDSLQLVAPVLRDSLAQVQPECAWQPDIVLDACEHAQALAPAQLVSGWHAHLLQVGDTLQCVFVEPSTGAVQVRTLHAPPVGLAGAALYAEPSTSQIATASPAPIAVLCLVHDMGGAMLQLATMSLDSAEFAEELVWEDSLPGEWPSSGCQISCAPARQLACVSTHEHWHCVEMPDFDSLVCEDTRSSRDSLCSR